MNTFAITSLKQPFHSRLSLPGSKSITNRALIMAALCQEPSQLNGLLESDDTLACRNAVKQLTCSSEKKIHCHDAGTVTRFLLPVCAGMGGTYRFEGSHRLRERPIKPLLDTLRQQGITFEFLVTENQMPFVMHSFGLTGGKITIDIQDSSQFLSGLCIAAPLSQKGFLFQSSHSIYQKPYILMTLNLMKKFGVEAIIHDEFTVEILPSTYQATQLTIEPDASTASYFFAAAAITQSTIEIEGLTHESLQGDIKFLAVLEKMGCQITYHSTSITVTGPEQLSAIHAINMNQFSDTFMTLSIIAPFLPAPTTIFGIQHTRLQESDRIAAVRDGLHRIGIRTESTLDSLTIFPGIPQGAKIHSYHDHRIAMAFSILGLKISDIRIESHSCVSKTCPDFFHYLTSLGENHVQ